MKKTPEKQLEYKRNYYKNNIEKMRKRRRDWEKKHPQRWKEIKKKSFANSDAGWVWNIKKLYGITKEDYFRLFAIQGGKCAVCLGNQVDGRRLSVDHCHSTGKIRGLLCNRCNQTLGFMKENPELFQKCIEYISKK